ncbi:MAG: DUF3179 domain-containing protein [Halobacteriales archaeon]
MRRRRYLSLLTSGLMATAGCLAAPGRESATASSTADSDSATAGVQQRGAADLPIPKHDLHRALERDSIPAIVDPVFADDWAGLSITVASEPLRESIEPRLSAGDPVIGVERNGQARAYPLALLNWHEVVNDDFDGPLLVTYCPLCQSGIVAERTVNGDATVFGVSGLLWRGNLVLYDRATDSLWSQLLGTAIRGPKTGSSLRLLPSSLTTWGEWRASHPDTDVLLPPPHSNTVRGQDATFNYTMNSYLGYAVSSQVGVGNTTFSDDRLHPKAPVVGIANGNTARAYPLEILADRRVINDTVGGKPVVVAITPDRSLVAYDRRIDESTLWFLPVADGIMYADRSHWQIATGRATDGPHEGTQLRQATDRSAMYWFAWAKFHPNTEIYGRS